MCIQLFEVSGTYSGKVYSFCTSVQWQKITVTFLRTGTKGQLFFLKLLSVLPTNEHVFREKTKKQKNYDFVSLLIYKEERLRKLLVYLLYLKQQFLVGVYFFEIVNLKINKGIPTNYCICSCGGKKIKFHI